MKAMVLAAGIGSRLKPLTDTTPKCLAKAGGKAMLEHTIERVKATGVREIVINLHHFPDAVRSFLKEKSNFGIKIDLSEESELLDTGGGLKQAKKFLEDSTEVLVHNSDVYTDFDLDKLVKFHLKEKPFATLLVMQRETDRRLLFDSAGNFIGHENRKSGVTRVTREVDNQKSLAFGGIYITSNEIFGLMHQQTDKFSIIDTFLLASKAGKRIIAMELKGDYWIDIGTTKKLEELNLKLGVKGGTPRH